MTASVNVERALTERNQALDRRPRSCATTSSTMSPTNCARRSPTSSASSSCLSDGSAGPLNEKQREYAGYVHAVLGGAAGDHQRYSRSRLDRRRRAGTDARRGRHREDHAVSRPKACRTASPNPRINLHVVAMDGLGTLRRRRPSASGRSCSIFSRTRSAFRAPGQTVVLAALRRDDEIVFKVTRSGPRHSARSPRTGVRPLQDAYDAARAIAASASACRSCVRSSNCMAARVLINSVQGEGTTVTCIFPARGAKLDKMKTEPYRLSQRSNRA